LPLIKSQFLYGYNFIIPNPFIKNQYGKTPLELASNDLREVLEGRKDISEIKLHQPVFDIRALLSILGENWLIPFKDAQCLEIIGKGNFGVVYKGIWNDKVVAIKKLRLNQGQSFLELLQNEVQSLSKMKHDNIITFYGYSIEENDFHVITEWLAQGSLSGLLQKERYKFSYNIILRISTDIAKGMKYVHECNLVHQDLRSANILVSDNWTSKIADFGLSVQEETLSRGNAAAVGALRWLAPEAILRQQCTNKIDVYSYGLLLYEIWSGEIPFKDLSPLQAAHAAAGEGKRPALSHEIPDNWQILIQSCWATKDSDRPTFIQVTTQMEKLKSATLLV